MEAIAERAGITKVTLYRHWPSKAALLADALLTELAAALPLDAEKPAWEAISSHATRLGAALDGDIGDLFRNVAAECMVEEAALREFRDRYLGLRRKAALRIIRAGLKDGSFTPSRRMAAARICMTPSMAPSSTAFSLASACCTENPCCVFCEPSSSHPREGGGPRPCIGPRSRHQWQARAHHGPGWCPGACRARQSGGARPPPGLRRKG